MATPSTTRAWAASVAPDPGGPVPPSPLLLSAWSGGRPVVWVRAGAALVAAGYGISGVMQVASGLGPAHERAFELLVAAAAMTAFAIARHHAGLAALLVLGGMGLEALSSLTGAPDLGTSALLVLAVLVVASGVLLGARAVMATTAAVLVAVPTMLVLGRLGAAPGGLTPLDASRLVVFELVAAGLGAMMWIAFRTFERVRAAAEERFALEAHLWHLQRLEIVGLIAGGAAHQFKNLLAVMQSTGDLLARHADPEVRAAGGDLAEIASRGAESARRLLDMARRDEPRGEEVELVAWAQRLGRIGVRLLGPERRFELRCTAPAPAWIDPTHLEQLVLNLLTNARDAAPPGGTVALSIRPVEPREAAALGSTLSDGAQVLLEVSDDGPGIAPEVMPRLFEPFVTSKPRGEGTGLGLHTVRSLAQLWNGCAAAESRPGAGATFRVFLPRAGERAGERAAGADGP